MTEPTQPPQGPWHPSQPGDQPIQYTDASQPQTWANVRPGDPVVPPPKKPRRFGRIAAIAGGAVAFMVVVGAVASSGTTPVEPAPVPAVTVTSDPEPAPTVTVKAEAEAFVPEVCTDAIEYGEDLDTLMGQATDIASEVIQAVVDSDSDAIDKANEDLDKLGPKIHSKRADFATAAQECRDSQ